MAKVIEPLREEKKLTAHFSEETKRVLIVFWHGLGDLVMFLPAYKAIKEQFPAIHFDLAVQEGLSFESIVPDALFINGDFLQNLESQDYDIVSLVHFPMSEGQVEFTKGEWCCIHELGIDPKNGHHLDIIGPNRLIGVHYNITCLPEAANPSKIVAEEIWNDILGAGFIPIETHFQHVFHNPVNEKFDFVDCSVRRVQPQISTLTGLLSQLRGFVGVVSGNFHCALAILPPGRVFFLEKHLKLECFTRLPIARASIKDGEYKGEVKACLKTLEQ